MLALGSRASAGETKINKVFVAISSCLDKLRIVSQTTNPQCRSKHDLDKMKATLKFEVQELRASNMTWTAVIGVSEFETLEEAMRYHDDANWKKPDWTLRGNEDMSYFRNFISESPEIVMVSHLDGGRRIIKM